MRIARSLLPFALTLLAVSGQLACQETRRAPQSAAQEAGARMTIRVETTAFAPGGNIPAQFTCSGANISPALRWSGVPKEAKSLALIVHDPDAPVGDFTHWLLYGVASSVSELSENVAKSPEVAGVGRQGTNDFRKIGYGGPCPPPGKPHRYFFRVYALDTELSLAAGADRAAVEAAMRGHVIAQGELMGKFAR
jgi:Raf kinase inhibitor-like YbhB/YbcL family protein